MSVLVEAPPVEGWADGPRRVGPYAVLGEIGPGRRTLALLAKDPAGAVLVLRQLREGQDPEAFEAELRTTKGLAVGEAPLPILREGSLLYAPHRAVVGESLGTILAQAFRDQRPLEIGIALTIAIGIAEKLALVAEQRPHGDLVPHHVLVGFDGSVHLRDPAGDAYRERILAPSRIGYRSPEHVRADPLSPASDVFSLGILLFEMSTGTRLFGEISTGLSDPRILEAQMPRPRDLVGDAYPIELQLVLRKLLRPTLAGRFADGKTTKEALRLVAATRPDAGSGALAQWMRTRFPDRSERWTRLTGPIERGASDLIADPTHPIPKDRPLSRAKTRLASKVGSSPAPLHPDHEGLEGVRQRLGALEARGSSGPVDPVLKAEIEALKGRRNTGLPRATDRTTLTDQEAPLRLGELPDLDPDPTEVADGPPLAPRLPTHADPFDPGRTFDESPEPSASDGDAFQFEAAFDSTAPNRLRTKKPQSKPMPPLDAPLPELPESLGGRANQPKPVAPLMPLGSEQLDAHAQTSLDEVVESSVAVESFPIGLDRAALVDLSGVPPLSESVDQANERTPLDLDIEVTSQEGLRPTRPPPRDSTLVDPLPPRHSAPPSPLSRDLILEREPTPAPQAEPRLRPARPTRDETDQRSLPDAEDTIDDDSVLNHLTRDELQKMAEATDIPPPPPKEPARSPRPTPTAPPGTATPVAPFRGEPAPLFREPPPLLESPPVRSGDRAREATQVVRDRVQPHRPEPQRSPAQQSIATQVVRDRIVPNDGPVPEAEDWAQAGTPTHVIRDREAAARAPTAPIPPSPRASGSEGEVSVDDGLVIIPISDDELARASRQGRLRVAVGLVFLGVIGTGGALAYRGFDTEVEAIMVPETVRAVPTPPPVTRPPPPPAPPEGVTFGATGNGPGATSGTTAAGGAEPPPPAQLAPGGPDEGSAEAPAPGVLPEAETPDLALENDEQADAESPPAKPQSHGRARTPNRTARPPPKAPPLAEAPPPPVAAPPVTIRVLPETATVLVNGREVKNGSVLDVQQTLKIEASAPGYEPTRATVEPGWSKPVLLMLRRAKTP